jgi:hypothetical protein
MVVVILEIGSHFLSRLAWTVTLLFYTSLHIWDGECAPPHQAFFCLDGDITSFSAQDVHE